MVYRVQTLKDLQVPGVGRCEETLLALIVKSSHMRGSEDPLAQGWDSGKASNCIQKVI